MIKWELKSWRGAFGMKACGIHGRARTGASPDHSGSNLDMARCVKAWAPGQDCLGDNPPLPPSACEAWEALYLSVLQPPHL